MEGERDEGRGGRERERERGRENEIHTTIYDANFYLPLGLVILPEGTLLHALLTLDRSSILLLRIATPVDHTNKKHTLPERHTQYTDTCS